MPRLPRKPLPPKNGARPRVVLRPAECFRRSRHDRALETVQDYVEAIADLNAAAGAARVVDDAAVRA